MQQANLPADFIEDIANLAKSDSAIYELLELWFDEIDQTERDAIIVNLQKHIDDDKNLPIGLSHRNFYQCPNFYLQYDCVIIAITMDGYLLLYL